MDFRKIRQLRIGQMVVVALALWGQIKMEVAKLVSREMEIPERLASAGGLRGNEVEEIVNPELMVVTAGTQFQTAASSFSLISVLVFQSIKTEGFRSGICKQPYNSMISSLMS